MDIRLPKRAVYGNTSIPHTRRMKIILIGAGRIGSAVAFCLANAGHDVTVVARGERLRALQSERAIVTVSGKRAPVKALPAVDAVTPYELVIVTVPEHQVPAILPQLSASTAKTILLMFNTFQGIAPYRSILGVERVAFGFPNMTAFLVNERVRFQVNGRGMVTTLSSRDLADLFKSAGMPSEYEDDMDSFLRSHVALVIPFFLAALLTRHRTSNLTWREAKLLDYAWTEGFDLVKNLGHPLKPNSLAKLCNMPSIARRCYLWIFSRSRLVKDLGEFGPTETRFLIDAMVAAGPAQTKQLGALRP